MSPVLLDHRNLKWVWVSLCLFVFMGFFGGYILGFEKSNKQWMTKLEPVAIDLPNVVTFELAETEAQPPEVVEPGASIDVDSVDAEYIMVVESDDSVELADDLSIASITVDELSQPEIQDPVASEAAPEDSAIVETANVDNARYSIQVGMYSSFDNAAKKVEKLLTDDLNAYIHEYQNQKDEIRYNVRFGYFDTFSSAGTALKVFEHSYAGSGYIAHINR